MSRMTTKEKILNLLSNYEQVYVENFVLKTMLSTANDARVRETWEQTLGQLSAHPNLADLRAKFAALRVQLSSELDAGVALDILLSIPTRGRPN